MLLQSIDNANFPDLNADGFPTDPQISALIGRVKGKLALKLHWMNDPHQNLGKLCKDEVLRTKSIAVMHQMVARKSLVLTRFGSWAFVNPACDQSKTKEAGQANYKGYAHGVARRAGKSEPAIVRFEQMFLQARGIFGPHKVQVDGEPCVVFPTTMVIGSEALICSSAIVVSFGRNGIGIGQVDGDAITTTWIDGKAVFSIVSDKIGQPAPDLGAALRESMETSPASIFYRASCPFSGLLDEKLKGALYSLHSQRDAATAFVGEDIDQATWKSWMGSACNVRRKEDLIRSYLFTSMDTEVRRAAMRDQQGHLSLYHWLCGTDETTRERRLQASAAFPILTPHLPQLQDTIDAGGELIPAIAAHFGIPKATVRALGGVHWQKLGNKARALSRMKSGDAVCAVISRLPPDMMPTKKKEWEIVVAAAKSFRGVLPGEVPVSAVLAIAKFDQFNGHLESGLFDAISDLVSAISKAAKGNWGMGDYDLTNLVAQDGDDREFDHETSPINELIVEMLFSKNAGKRLAKFASNWHRQHRTLHAVCRSVQRRVLGEYEMIWAPLLESAYEHRNGYIAFLSTENELAKEGVLMQHCVAQYGNNCLRGISHVCHITGADGSHSTAELCFENDRLYVKQHRAFDNTEPSQNNVTLVADFVARANREKLADPEKLALQSQSAVAKYRSAVIKSSAMTEAECEFIIAAYKPLLTQIGLPVTLADWRSFLPTAS